MEHPLEEFQKSFLILSDDIVRAEKEMKASDSQYSRRVYIRTAFALIEGFTYLTKFFALNLANFRGVPFSPAQIALLKEESYELSKKGKARVRTKFLRLAENFRFGASCLAQSLGSDFTLAVEGEGWKCFRKAIEIRNRIIHPRFGSDLDISNEDLQIVTDGMAWFHKSTIDLFGLFGESDL